MNDGKLRVRHTFLEVVDEAGLAEGEGLRRRHSAPPNLEASRLEEGPCDEQCEDAARLTSSPVLFDTAGGATAGRNEDWLTEPVPGGLARGGGADATMLEGLEGRDINQMTTVILRNVPHAYTRDDLLELLDAQGFSGRYDFVYLPVKFGSSCAFGYALVNLVDHEDAKLFQAHFQNFSSWNVPCSNSASVSWSKAHQGLAEHVERYRNSPMMHSSIPDDCKPIMLQDGVRVAFPPPTKKAAPQRRAERTKHSRNRDGHGQKGGPGSVSSLTSEVSSSDPWKAPSISSASTPADSTAHLAEPTESPLFKGLTWLGGYEEPATKQTSTPDIGLYELTTQMICGSECSSEQSLRSSVPGSCRSVGAAPSTCSSRRGPMGRGAAERSPQGAAAWSNTLLAAGLEAVPDAGTGGSPLANSGGRRLQESSPRKKGHQTWHSAWTPGCGPVEGWVGAAAVEAPCWAPVAGPLAPGSVVEIVNGVRPSGEHARILLVDHARKQYKVQLCDGSICMVKAKNARLIG